MKRPDIQRTYWLIAVFVGLFLLVPGKGCKQDRSPVDLEHMQQHGLSLELSEEWDSQAKATGVTVTAEGLDEQGNPTGQDKVDAIISNPTFPLDIPLMLYDPPCLWQITVIITLTRDLPRTASTEINVCQENHVELVFDTFEEMQISTNPINAPESADAGETITVSCGPVEISAPDSDIAPPSATLRERGGRSVSGPIGSDAFVSGSFPDPFPLTSSQNQRVFTCTISDGRSPSQTFEKFVRRIPTQPLIPTVTPISPSPSSNPPDSNSPPTTPPAPCQVTNGDNKGVGSLRWALANGCSMITFGVTSVTLDSELTIPSGTLTIDGGPSGVTIKGGNNKRVFYVDHGADVTFENLIITNGDKNKGSGIYNDGGTVTIASSSTLSANDAVPNRGGGIYNDRGIVIIDGTISGNKAKWGGGVYNDGGTVTINGTATVTGNTADKQGGGVYNDGGTVTINGTGTITGNTATDDEGGGIYNDGGTINNATASTVFGNTAHVCDDYYDATTSTCIPL